MRRAQGGALRANGSTLDVAHAEAAVGAPAGTLVLADEQTAGRGRQGRNWVSEPGIGIWLTLIERPADSAAVQVLSLRLGLHAARVLDGFATAQIGLKWPNDLFVQGRKLAGILVEARWREGLLDWIAIGFGINVQRPRGLPGVAALRHGTRRVDVLACLVPALRGAASEGGELRRGGARSVRRARHRARAPVPANPSPGMVAGLDASGALLVQTPTGTQAVRVGIARSCRRNCESRLRCGQHRDHGRSVRRRRAARPLAHHLRRGAHPRRDRRAAAGAARGPRVRPSRGHRGRHRVGRPAHHPAAHGGVRALGGARARGGHRSHVQAAHPPRRWTSR